MYFVKYGDRYLHDPRTDDYKLFDLTLESEENTCGYCDFTIYPNHPMYNKIKERDTVNSIDVYDDDELLFSGFIYELGYKFQLDGHVKCKGDLSYLNDSIVRPYSTLDRSYGDKAPQTVNNYFEWLINQHNAQVDDNKKFIVGINQGSNLDPNNYILRENNKYPSTIEEIKEKLLDNLGGYIRTRKEKNIRYIDYIAEWSKANTQILDFGINLTDYAQTDDSASIATFVVPLGAKISETEYPYDDGYRQTEDKVKDPNKIYYIHNYSRSGKIAKFEEGVTYYEQFIDTYVTTDASPVVGITYYVIYSVSETGEVTYMSVDISRFEPGVTYYERENYYRVTTDKTPTDAKDYYILQSAYTTVGDLGRFRKYETYYEYDVNKDESNTSLTIKGYEDKKILIIADGAAFGPEMDTVMKKINLSNGMAIYLPESFEWLILKSDVIRDKDIAEVLDHPSDFIESKEYMSWERFFTALLVDKTKDTYLRYSKSKLNDAYKNRKIQEKILREIPDQLL